TPLCYVNRAEESRPGAVNVRHSSLCSGWNSPATEPPHRSCVRPGYLSSLFMKADWGRVQFSVNGDKGSRRATALRRIWERLKKHPLARLGPGLITGVADDDPSGIATYSQAGAQFGLNMLWTMPLAYPLMSAIQSMCAQIGRFTGRGLAANIKVAFPP